MSTPIGVYLHTPFCDGKCPYCDFYSQIGSEQQKDAYADVLCESIRSWGERLNHRPVDTIYFGGGTPNLMGSRLVRLLHAVYSAFPIDAGAEITVEVNPSRDLQTLLPLLRQAGFNRLSVGLQSANETELRFLGRKHGAAEVLRTVSEARSAGFENISLDLMLALEGQTADSLRRSVAFCAELGVEHVSAYLLKIEPGTVFGKREASLHLPDEEGQRELYLEACAMLEEKGFRQYEISNFAKSGRESRHNLRYWNAEEYLGLGPAAHSFVNGQRFFYPRSLSRFLTGAPPEQDGLGGDFEEYAMLRLRLKEGLCEQLCQRRYGHPIPAAMRDRAARLKESGLLVSDAAGIRLTRAGFLVSNAVIGELLE